MGYGWGDVKKCIDFLGSSSNFPDFCLKFCPLKPPTGGVGVKIFLLIFWTVHDISRTFEFLTPKILHGTPWGGVGQMFLGSNDSQMNPHLGAKVGRGPTVVSKKKGTDTHTDVCLKFCPLKPPTDGVGVNIFLLIFWTVHDISRTFEFLTPKILPGTSWGWVKCF